MDHPPFRPNFPGVNFQKQEEAIMSRFPSNIDPHLRSQHMFQHSQVMDLNPSSYPNLHMMSSNHQTQNTFGAHKTTDGTSIVTSSGNYFNSNNVNAAGSSFSNPQQQQQLDQANRAELQMAYQDAWQVCHPDFKRPFTSLEDACERLLPYHVVADYEEEEDDKILDSDTSGQLMSRSQQWDHNISTKVAEFTATFEKQVLAFNIISNKQNHGELRTEEKLMIEQMLLQDEKRALLEARAEMESRQRAGRMAAMAHSEHARADFPSHPEMLFQAPIRGAALGFQTSNIPVVHNMNQQDQGANTAAMITGWGNIGQKDEKEPSDDFLNDEETENGDAAIQGMWQDGGDLDLNAK